MMKSASFLQRFWCTRDSLTKEYVWELAQRPYFTLSHTERERPYSTNRKARTGITSPRGKSTRVREEKTRLDFSEELDSWRLFWWSQIEIA